MKKIKIPKIVKLAIKLLLAAGALYLVLKNIDSKQLLSLLNQSNIWLLIIAILLFILSKIISAYRLNYFLRDVEVIVSTTSNLKLYWLGMYYNIFLPGGIGGDGYKIYLLNKLTGIKTKNIFLAVLLDRITGLLALICLAALLAFFLPIPVLLKYAVWLIIPITIASFYSILKIWFKPFLRSFVVTNIQSFGVQVSQLICSYLILLAMGITDDIGIFLFIFLMSSIIATIPFTIGGFGARELTFLYAAKLLDLKMEPAIGLSFIFFAITALVSLSGIHYSFSLKNTKLLNEKEP